MEEKFLESVQYMIESLGENIEREGLIETPKRVYKAWQEMFKGYNEKESEILSTSFEQEDMDEMIILKNIEFYSTCEHHILPFIGKASIGYIPDTKIVGISKLARLLDCFAKRLQIQERLTSQIANSIMTYLKPKGVGVVIEAKHLCMKLRGIKKQDSIMQTSCLLGIFREKEVRQEFLRLISNG